MIRGLIATMSVPDVLDWAERRQISGTLSFERGAVRRVLDLEAGTVGWVASSHPAEQLGRILVGAGLLTDSVVEEVLRVPDPIGRTLVQRGLISEANLRAALELKVVEALYDLLSWDDGSFAFDAVRPPDRGEVPLAISLALCRAEGEARAAAWRAVRERVPDDDARFHAETFAGTDDGLLQDVARGLSVREIMLERRWLPFRTYQALGALAEKGAITLMRSALPGSPERVAATARALLGRDTVPRLLRTQEELDGLDLSPAERALLRRVDGRWDAMTLVLAAGPSGEVEALVLLERLAARGLVAFD